MNDRAKVLFFATLRDKAGVRETSIEFKPGSTIRDIKAIIIEKYPAIKPMLDTIIVAMNHEFAFDETQVPDGAEIAIFPPVSGGSRGQNVAPTILSIINHEINVNEVLEKITLESTGSACLFAGIVRRVTKRGKPHYTDELEYEAYHEMALAKMRLIADEIRARWPDVEGIALVQRIGTIEPGKVSVVIGCASSHRDAGIFEAAHFGIDRLKEIVPIWKKEIGPDGEEWVEGEYFPTR